MTAAGSSRPARSVPGADLRYGWVVIDSKPGAPRVWAAFIAAMVSRPTEAMLRVCTASAMTRLCEIFR